MKKKLLFIVNEGNYFISHRLPIAVAAHEIGYEIHVATTHSFALPPIEGFFYHVIPLSRSGKNIFSELKSLVAIYKLQKLLQPDLVHLITAKPVIYGAIAARLASVPTVIAAITGLGYAFISQHLEARMLRCLISQLYRVAFRHKNLKVIFQNADDREFFHKIGALKKNQSFLIQGSGIDLRQYPYQAEPDTSSLVVVMAARLLRQKGLFEYIEAAKLLKAKGSKARFLLAGCLDPANPSSINEQQLQDWLQAELIEYLGYSQNIPRLFSQANLVVLPSYGEGFPRILIEAAACGRAIVTTDVPGCRAAIIPGKTGILIKPNDGEALAEAIHALLINPTLRKAMGIAGRKMAENQFNMVKIVQEHLQVYKPDLCTNEMD